MKDEEMTPNSSIELSVRGMHCGSCVARVESALRKVPGVAGASVDLRAERAHVALADPGVSPAALIAAIAEAGYQASLLSARAEG